MRAKHLLMATALLSFMASCNDDMVNEAIDNWEVQAPALGVVGAELLGNSATIGVPMQADSRIVNQAWEQNDKMGLGWFNIHNKGIQAVQPTTFTDKDAIDTDNKLYGNHMFVFDMTKGAGGSYTAYSNVYAGAHFAYFPYTYMSDVKVKEVALDNIQDKAALDEKQNGNFWLSLKRIFSKADVNQETGEINTEMPLREVSNALVFKFTAPKGFAENDVLKKIQLEEMNLIQRNKQFSVNLEKAFYTTATVDPNKLEDQKAAPYTANDKLVYDEITKYFTNVSNFIGTLPTDNKALTLSDAKNILSTKITDASVVAGANQDIVMHLFPVPADNYAVAKLAAHEKVPASVRIKTNWGRFDFNKADAKGMDKVAQFMNNEVPFGKTTVGINSRANVTFNLDLNEAVYTPHYNISDAAEWYQALEVANALHKVYGKKFETAEFVLDKNVTLTEGIFKTGFTTDVKFTVKKKTQDYTLTLEGKNVMPSNVTFDNGNGGAEFIQVNVAEGATLDIPAGVEAEAYFVNYGTINVAPKGKISSVANEGRINVEYGSFVWGLGGQIAYTINKDTKPYMVNYLMTPQQNKPNQEWACVNTLVINAGETLDLSEVYTSQGFEDPYRPVKPTTEGYNKNLMKNAQIELNGGTLIDSKIEAAGRTWIVKSLNVLNGGTLKDVTVSNDVTVNAGELKVEAKEFEKVGKLAQNFKSFTNKDKAVFDVNATVATLINNLGAHLTVNPAYMITWTIKYDQNGTTTGKVEKRK